MSRYDIQTEACCTQLDEAAIEAISLRQLVGRLDGRQRDVVEGLLQGLTHIEIAAKLRVTDCRVSQIRKKAILSLEKLAL